MKTVYNTCLGVGNGIIIVIFTEIYKRVCYFVVNLENHKYDSHYENSFIFKKCFFDFILSYINLGYYAFYKQDFKLLANSFISIIITKNLIFAAKVASQDQPARIRSLLVEEDYADEEVETLPEGEKREVRMLKSSRTIKSKTDRCVK